MRRIDNVEDSTRHRVAQSHARLAGLAWQRRSAEAALGELTRLGSRALPNGLALREAQALGELVDELDHQLAVSLVGAYAAADQPGIQFEAVRLWLETVELAAWNRAKAVEHDAALRAAWLSVSWRAEQIRLAVVDPGLIEVAVSDLAAGRLSPLASALDQSLSSGSVLVTCLLNPASLVR